MDLNVNRGVVDIYYRYKMPRLLTKNEGRGKKTVILNIEEVGKALARPPSHIAKYFGYKLGTQSQVKGKQLNISGVHDAETLQNHLDGFITEFVLCVVCENPETVLMVNKKVLIKDCKACGNCERMNGESRLVQYVVKSLESK